MYHGCNPAHCFQEFELFYYPKGARPIQETRKVYSGSDDAWAKMLVRAVDLSNPTVCNILSKKSLETWLICLLQGVVLYSS